MKDYLSNDVQIITEVDENNCFKSKSGKTMYDGVSTLLNTNLGHKNSEVMEEIVRQLHILDSSSLFTSTNEIAISCSEKLCEITDGHYYSTFFTNSGSEACDTALKIVLKYWKNKGENRNKILSLSGAYHGASVGGMMLAHGYYPMEDYSLGHANFHQTPQPDPLKCPEGMDQEAWVDWCIEEFQRYCRENEGKIAAIFFELVQLSNAANALPTRFVTELDKCCKERGILVVVDEVATGFGRTGSMFASDDYGIKGDLMMLAKGISSGYVPMGAVLVTEEIYRGFYGKTSEKKQLDHGYTTAGHPVACAAALKTIEVMEKTGCVEEGRKTGEYLLREMNNRIGNSPLVETIRGKGLMLAIIFKKITIKSMEEWGVAEILTSFLINKGLLLYPDSPTVLIIAPPLNVTTEECDRILSALEDSVKKIEFLMDK
ncbi:MAG: aspartate aminotransferase family protein [Anaerovoracaceae bacterium]